jgi:threonine/homoserine/homoserine lactone efflux protein
VLEVLSLGVFLGLGAGLSVGPIFLTIVAESARSGFLAGLRIIVGSAAADVVLIFPALAASWVLSSVAAAAFWVGIVGGAFFVLLAADAARQSYRLLRQGQVQPIAEKWGFWKGVVGNLANPLTWSFWLLTGTPTMLQANRLAGVVGLVVFTVTWFVVAMAVEAAVGLIAARGGKLVGTRGLAAVNACSAALFLGIAGRLVAGALLGEH